MGRIRVGGEAFQFNEDNICQSSKAKKKKKLKGQEEKSFHEEEEEINLAGAKGVCWAPGWLSGVETD